MMPAQRVGRSIVMSASLVDRIGGARHGAMAECTARTAVVLYHSRLVASIWALRHQLHHVVDAGPEDEEIDNDKDQQRRPDLLRRQGRGGIRGAQHPVDDPGLTSNFGGDPAGEQRNQTGGPHSQREALEPARVIKSLSQAKYQSEHAEQENK